MKHRFSEALHILADDTSVFIELYRHGVGWHRGSYYVIDKGDRDMSINIRLVKNGKVIWTENNKGA